MALLLGSEFMNSNSVIDIFLCSNQNACENCLDLRDASLNRMSRVESEADLTKDQAVGKSHETLWKVRTICTLVVSHPVADA